MGGEGILQNIEAEDRGMVFGGRERKDINKELEESRKQNFFFVYNLSCLVV